MAITIEQVHTPCKNCIFAVYKEKTQTGCKLGRTAKFQAAGNLVEAEDTEKEFFIVNGRYCNAFQDPNSKFAKNFKPEDWVATMRKGIQLRLSVLVVLENAQHYHDLDITAESLKNQTLPPHQVIFVNNQKTIRPSEFHARLFKLLGNSITWRINQICEPNASKGRAIDHAMTNVDGAFYTVIEPGFALPPDFIRELDVSLNDNMERFSLLLPHEGNCLTVQTSLHKHPFINGHIAIEYDGKVMTDVAEKIAFYAEMEEKSYMIRGVTEICHCLRQK